jgi:hypothetical protein
MSDFKAKLADGYNESVSKAIRSRLAVENDELLSKIIKLEDFLFSVAGDEKKANEIDRDQVMLMEIQLNAMKAYSNCLTARIDRL